MLASTADSAQFWRIGQNWPCYLARPFHALFARISCNTFLEPLKHTDQPWVFFVSGVCNFIKNGFSLLWAIYGYVVRYCILTFRIATIPGEGRNSSNIRGQMNEWPSFSTCQTSLLILPEMTLSGTSLFLRFLSPVETEAPISKTPSLLEINKTRDTRVLRHPSYSWDL